MKNATNSKTKLTATIAIFLLMVSAFVLMAAPIKAQGAHEGGSIPLPAGVTPDFREKLMHTLAPDLTP